MKDDLEKDEEFDPTKSEEFLKNLELALNPNEDEQEKWETKEKEEDEQSANITEDSADLPTLDISDSLFQVDSEERDFEEKEPAEDVLLGINTALAEQIEQQFGKITYDTKKEPGKIKKFLNSIPKWTKVLAIVLFLIVLFFGLLFGTSAGRGLISRVVVEILFGGINTPSPDSDYLITVTPEPTGTGEFAVTPEPTEAIPTVAVPTGETVEDNSVINVLLLGEENMFHAARGRTDAILVVSLDKDGGPIKLISFMRDLYVSIPGYKDNKLNAAYTFGGAKLMMETIETNFKIKLDGYVLVNFSGFEEIIDQLGGIEISLTVQESEYLNSTKYISKVEERNTVPGTQLLSGSQVLGYCRVRKVKTANGLDSDFGRTYRQRLVLQKLFDKYKEKNYAELLSLMNKCLGYVTAPESLKSIAAECLQTVIENKMFDLDTMQMPVGGLFENKIINSSDVIVYWPENNIRLHDFIYNNEE